MLFACEESRLVKNLRRGLSCQRECVVLAPVFALDYRLRCALDQCSRSNVTAAFFDYSKRI
jgi:hypothetical protein